MVSLAAFLLQWLNRMRVRDCMASEAETLYRACLSTLLSSGRSFLWCPEGCSIVIGGLKVPSPRFLLPKNKAQEPSLVLQGSLWRRRRRPAHCGVKRWCKPPTDSGELELSLSSSALRFDTAAPILSSVLGEDPNAAASVSLLGPAARSSGLIFEMRSPHGHSADKHAGR